MRGRFFLDTNVFVYSFDGSAPEKALRASRLIREAVSARTGIVSYQVVQEFFNVAFRRFAPPMTVQEAAEYLATVFVPLVAVHSSRALYAEALRVRGAHGLSWYDSLIVAGAIQGECAILYSEDLQHGQRFGDLVVQNPFLPS